MKNRIYEMIIFGLRVKQANTRILDINPDQKSTFIPPVGTFRKTSPDLKNAFCRINFYMFFHNVYSLKPQANSDKTFEACHARE